ncbi:hypothetical protein [Desulfonema magnum]|uniref:Uncharacterized protein n=1 Tax=Desulfonema magnum TaxID=45655 RepID=A0A975BMJ7_9BACT|nr:hypothetical protein [Desulfonema magnum]QTA87933.1 Uncharacterized protein dnm_039720 [Desulfonema magnum]
MASGVVSCCQDVFSKNNSTRGARRFLKNPNPLFCNAIRKDFEQVRQNLLKNDAIKLLLNVEMHLEGYKHAAPTGLLRMGLPKVYKHAAPTGLLGIGIK